MKCRNLRLDWIYNNRTAFHDVASPARRGEREAIWAGVSCWFGDARYYVLASGRQPGDDGGVDTGLTVRLMCSDTQMAADTTQSQSEILTSLLATTAIHRTGEDAAFPPGFYTLRSNLKSIFQCVILSSRSGSLPPAC